MNINTATLNQDDLFGPGDGESLAEIIREHQEIVQREGRYVLTDKVALVSDPDPNYPGALQVWSKTTEGPWVWVSTDGDIIESACPIGD